VDEEQIVQGQLHDMEDIYPESTDIEVVENENKEA
jgi:hypothetical protein